MNPEYTDKFLAKAGELQSDAPTVATTQSVLLSIYGAAVSGDYAAMAEHFTDDIELRIAGCGPLDGHWEGRSQVAAATEANFKSVGNQNPEMERMLVQGDSIVVLLHETGVFRESGKSYRSRVVQWFTFEGQKVKRVDQIGTMEC